MNNKKLILNVSLVFITLASVLAIRTQSAVISYEVANKNSIYKKQNASMNLITAEVQKKSGAENIVTQSASMVALSAPKTEQVVMVNDKGMAISN